MSDAPNIVLATDTHLTAIELCFPLDSRLKHAGNDDFPNVIELKRALSDSIEQGRNCNWDRSVNGLNCLTF